MTTESLLVKTKDNNVIAFSITFNNMAEKFRLIKQCENYCHHTNYKDFDPKKVGLSEIVFDESNTTFLKREILGYPYKRCPENFVNEMKNNNYPPKLKKPGVLHFDIRLSDDFFPSMIKNTGYHIKPHDELYQVRFNKSSHKYEIVDFKICRAQVSHDDKRITITRNHFEFSHDAFTKLQIILGNFRAAQRANPKLSMMNFASSITDSANRSLFEIYAREQANIDHLDSTISHELKHVKNSIFIHGIKLKDDYKQLSVDNMYRVCVENERSAYLEQLIHCVNTYLKAGNYDDFSMFDGESKWCVKELKSLRTKEERMAFLSNHSLFVEKSLQQFSSMHKKYYDDNQFESNLRYMVETEPLSVSKDADGEIFRRIRSLFYHYMIYNPKTGKEESISLSKYITPDLEVEISDEIRKRMVDRARENLQKDEEEFINNKNEKNINIDLLIPAKSLIRGAMLSSSNINEIDGIDVGRLPEGRLPERTDTAPIPDDKASWSDDLQKYWSKIDGYKEIAKNNREYSFEINQSRVTYTDKNHVNVGSNADFELYVKLLKEPSSKNNVIKFAPTLSKEQALMLYIACTNYGRKMSGQVPTDLSGIDKLTGIPAAEMNKFKHRTAGSSTHHQTNVNIAAQVASRTVNGGR